MKINSTKNTAIVDEFYDVKRAYTKLILIGFQFILLFILVFATINTFAQAPTAIAALTTTTTENQAKKLEFVKQSAVFNTGKVYVNWIAKSNSPDCIYVIERSDNQTEFEPVGLKEGIGSTLELLYSWVDNKPLSNATQYRIKQINNEGSLIAQSDPSTVTTPEISPLRSDSNTKTASKK